MDNPEVGILLYEERTNRPYVKNSSSEDEQQDSSDEIDFDGFDPDYQPKSRKTKKRKKDEKNVKEALSSLVQSGRQEVLRLINNKAPAVRALEIEKKVKKYIEDTVPEEERSIFPLKSISKTFREEQTPNVSLPSIQKSSQRLDSTEFENLLTTMKKERRKNNRSISTLDADFFLPFVRERDGMGRLINSHSVAKLKPSIVGFSKVNQTF